MENKKVFITKSFDETQKIGEDFISMQLQNSSTRKHAIIIALYGNLGAGKTTFTQGIAKGLGINKRIISPTFIIIRHYKINKQSAKFFYHIDLYRTHSKDDIEGLGMNEIIKNLENVVIIEWAERLGDLLPKERADVYFEYIDEEKRKIKITKQNMIND